MKKSRQQQQTLSYANHYAQTISRASNLHQLQLLRASNGPTSFQYQYSPLTAMQDRGLTMQSQKAAYESPMSLQMGADTSQIPINRPLCRCRVMYLGSSVPHMTKNGLHGIQEPLKHLYPEEQFSGGSISAAGQQQSQGSGAIGNAIDISHLSASLGIDSWLSVWSNGLLLENVDEFGREIKRFFSIESLHYCAAVRFFDTTTLMTDGSQRNSMQPDATPTTSDLNNNTIDAAPAASDPALSEPELRQSRRKSAVRFLPLDAPLFQWPGMLDPSHPPMFASILRRTTGIKVLECHAFICRRDAAANALVRCCTHAYADFLSAKRLSIELGCAESGLRGGATRSRSLYRTPATSGRPASSHYEPASGELNIPASRKNSSTANSNSLEDNSQETSSEDNYAIISRHHQPRGPSLAPPTLDGAPEQQAPKVKGSSKSLFSDFKPKTNEQAQVNCISEAGLVDKLSQSLDVLELADTCCGEEAAGSAVGPKNKRHSRSMQNLEARTSEFCASSVGSTSSLRARRGAKQQRLASKSGRCRKTASYQDVAEAPRGKASGVARSQVTRREEPAGSRALYASLETTASKASGARLSRPTGTKRRERSRTRQAPAALQQHPPMPQQPRPQQLAYPPNPIYLPCYLPPPPQSAHFLPQPQQQPIYSPLYDSIVGYPHLHQQPPPLVHAHPLLSAHQSALYAATLAPRRPNHKKQQLAARFRCLSPPANFMGGPKAAEASGELPPEQLNVVSARPALLAGSREKKMSWIKRLSLTISSAGFSDDSGADTPTASSAAAPRPAQQQTQVDRPKRRSSLFSGSLTLGRSRSKQTHTSLLT